MRHRETVDEAIDRVATRMTQGAVDRVDIRPVWLAESGSQQWPSSWRVAGVVGVVMVALVFGVMRAPRPEERSQDMSLAVSELVPWSPLRAAVADTGPVPSGAFVRSGRPLGRPIRAALKGGPYTFGAPSESDAWPTWGIPFIEPPAALAVEPPAMVQIDIETVGVDAIEITPLTVSPIDDGVQGSEVLDFAQAKASDFAQAKE